MWRISFRVFHVFCQLTFSWSCMQVYVRSRCYVQLKASERRLKQPDYPAKYTLYHISIWLFWLYLYDIISPMRTYRFGCAFWMSSDLSSHQCGWWFQGLLPLTDGFWSNFSYTHSPVQQITAESDGLTMTCVMEEWNNVLLTFHDISILSVQTSKRPTWNSETGAQSKA